MFLVESSVAVLFDLHHPTQHLRRNVCPSEFRSTPHDNLILNAFAKRSYLCEELLVEVVHHLVEPFNAPLFIACFLLQNCFSQIELDVPSVELVLLLLDTARTH